MMNESRSFDRAAGYYDQTRPLPEAVAHEGIQAILAIAGAGRRILEVGAGTGRISIPLLERGADLIGCDLSGNMLRRLHEKYPAARIARADATLLPFPASTFDTVMTVHVLHLVPGWRQALHEFRRLLKPGGTYLNVKTWASDGVSIRDQVRMRWRTWMAERGMEVRTLGVHGGDDFLDELRSLGGEVGEQEIIRYPLVFTLREELERLTSRILSETWEIPEVLFAPSMEELRRWMEEEYGDLDQPRQDQLRFSMDLARF